MARIRYIKPEYFDDEDIAQIPFEAERLFQGLWVYADREGKLEYRPKYLKAKIFPYHDKITTEDIITLLNLLSNPNIPERPNKKFIVIYEVSDRKYIKILSSNKHFCCHHT